MLPQFLQKQFYNFLCLGVILSQTSFATSISPLLDLENLIKEQNKKAKVILESHQANFSSLIKDLNIITSISIDPSYINSTLFYSDVKYLDLATSNDPCFYTQMLEYGLIKPNRLLKNKVLVNIKNKNTTKKYLLSLDNFLELHYRKNCFEQRELRKKFSSNNIESSLSKIKITTPKTYSECSGLLSLWKQDNRLPLLCSLHEENRSLKSKISKQSQTNANSIKLKSDLKKSNKILDSLPPKTAFFVSNLCTNLNNEKKFCSSYLEQSIWSKIKNKEAPSYLVEHTCRLLTKKENSSKKRFNQCLNKMQKEKNFCSTISLRGFNSLFPHENCHTLSDLLSEGRLKTDYKDCSGNFDNLALINTVRVLSHKNSITRKTNKENCTFEINRSFAQIYQDFNNMGRWPLAICYPNKVTKEEECLKYIPGNNKDHPLSENNIIKDILYKNEAALSNLTCNLISKDIYRPSRLSFSSGCFITYDPENCTPLHCPKKVIYNKNEIKYIKYKGQQLFDYYPISYKTSKFSISNILKEAYKIDFKDLRNYSDIKFFFKSHPKGIIQGLGCVEDIHSEFFMRTTLNQCSPIPFIIDGYIEKDSTKWLVFRSSAEDVHFPRKVLWNRIFTAVKNYQKLHPQRTWFLNGIK